MIEKANPIYCYKAYGRQCAAPHKARKPSWEAAAVSTWWNANTTFCVTTQTQQQVSMTPLSHKDHVSSVDFHFYCIKQDLSLLPLFVFKTCVCLLCLFRIHNLFQPVFFKNLTAVRICFLAEWIEMVSDPDFKEPRTQVLSSHTITLHYADTWTDRLQACTSDM